MNALKLVAFLFIITVIIRVWMRVAENIGKQFFFGKIFLYLWEKIRSLKIRQYRD